MTPQELTLYTYKCIIILAAIAFLIYSLSKLRKSEHPRGSTHYPIPYRRILRRYHAPEDPRNIETVYLECGHLVKLHHHERSAIPCPQCPPDTDHQD